MKKLFVSVALAFLSIPLLAGAQSAFDGTWKIDMNKVDFSKKPDVYVLQNGMYDCKTCTPPFKVKADGTDQAITGHPYYDTVAIKVVNDHQVDITNKKDGKVVATSTSTVSSDGNTTKFSFSDRSNTNGGPPVTGKGESTLVAKGPAGSHAISGSWRTTKIEVLSDNGTVWTNKVSGNELTMTNPTGQTYTAKMDGADAPMKGDPGTTSVAFEDDRQEHARGNGQARWQSDRCLEDDGWGRRQDCQNDLRRQDDESDNGIRNHQAVNSQSSFRLR